MEHVFDSTFFYIARANWYAEDAINLEIVFLIHSNSSQAMLYGKIPILDKGCRKIIQKSVPM